MLIILFFLSSNVIVSGQATVGKYGSNVNFRLNDAVWYIKSFEKTDVYYYHNKEQADIILRLSIKAQQELSQFFDYAPYNRVQIRLYKDGLDYCDVPSVSNPELLAQPFESNHVHAENEQGIYSPYYKALPIFVAPIYASGSYHKTYCQLKFELARLYIRDMLFSAERGSKISRSNFWLPSWFYTGLPAYIAEGLSSDEISLLRTIHPDEAYDYLFSHQITPTQRIVQKAFWAYMARSHSYKKISEIVYMTRLSRSVESGFQTVLGLGTQSVFAQWHESFEKEFFNTHGLDLASSAQLVPLLKQNERLISFTRHPKLPIIAFVTSKNGVFRLNMYDLKKKQRSEVVKIPTFSNYHHLADLNIPIAYNPSGNILLTCLPFENHWAIYNFTNRNLTYLPIEGQLDMINSISFSPDGKNVILSAVKEGATDLFLFSLSKSNFTQLTFDAYDDLFAYFNTDSTVVFSSNRDTVLLYKSKANLNALIENSLDIYELKIKNKSITRLTNTPYYSERIAGIFNKNLILLNDQNGVTNLVCHTSKDSAEQRVITAFKQGITGINTQGKGILVSSYYKGMPVVFSGDTLDIKSNYPVTSNLYVEARKAVWREKEYLRKKRENKIEEQHDLEHDHEHDHDGTTDTIVKPVRSRFYVFDDDTDTSGRRTPKKITIFKKRTGRKNIEHEEPILDINTLKITSIFPYKRTLYYKAFRGIIESDPAFGLNGMAKILFEDPFAKQRLTVGMRLFLNMRNSDFFARYQWFQNRVQWEVGMHYSRRFFENPQQFTYNNINIYGVGSYPFNQFNRISIRPFINYSIRTDLRLNDLIYTDESASVYGSDLNYTFDQSRSQGGTTLSGVKANAGIRVGNTLQTPARLFTEVSMDLRAYQPLFNHKVIFAARFSAGAFLGDHQKSYFFGGYPGAIGLDVDSKSNLGIQGNAENFAFSHWVMPVRGYNLNARTGSQFGLINMEMRMPLGLILKRSQPVKNPYNVLWTIFYDVGTTWRTGNPFSQRNPIDATQINAPPFTISVQSLKSPFLMGVGTGLRVLILGHYVRGDIAWSIEDGALGNAKFVVSLTREF